MNMKKKIKNIVIYGAGDFGKEVLWTINDCNKVSKEFNILGFIDDELKKKEVNSVPILGNIDWIKDNQNDELGCILALSDTQIRKNILEKLLKLNVDFPNIIHPSVQKAENCKLGKGVIIQHNSIISVEAKIGDFVHMNYNCMVGHDCIIDNFVTLSPGVYINGESIIEENTFFGTGAITKDEIKIGSSSIIGAGAVVTKNIPKNSIFLGPSGKLKTF
tara:strand:- start:94 stop:747 length:654 start_codon:yes stop_codon:yes gene_type:complete